MRCVYVPNALFFARRRPFLVRPRVFPRAFGCGAQGGRVYTTRKFETRLGSVARALGVQSRASCQVMTGSLSAQKSQPGPCNPSKDIFFTSAAVPEVEPHTPSKVMQSKYDSRPSSLSLCGSQERCFCVCVHERACVCVCILQQ